MEGGAVTPLTGPPYNVVEMAKANGAVVVTVRWAWDGVSLFLAREGTVVDVRARNLDTITWSAQLPKKGKGAKWIDLAPGSDVTYTGGQLKSAGLDLISMIGELTLTPAA